MIVNAWPKIYKYVKFKHVNSTRLLYLYIEVIQKIVNDTYLKTRGWQTGQI